MKRYILLFLVFILFSLFCLVGIAFSVENPHGGYASTTDKCSDCHTLHDAPGGYKLLLGATFLATCEVCHGAGGQALFKPYTTIGVTTLADHNPNATLTASSTLGIGTPEEEKPLCGGCHSPHDRNTVNPYISDTSATYSSSRLLRKGGSQTYAPSLPGYGTQTISDYSGDWCTDCHNVRTGMGGTNHQTNTAALTWANSSLARSNGAYRMSPAGWQPRTSPICQYCHEDSREVDDDVTDAILTFTCNSPTTYSATDNPGLKFFPHRTENPLFRLETGDDLCLNCHPTSQLPE